MAPVDAPGAIFSEREASGRRRNKDNIGRLITNLIPSLWRLGESDGSGAAMQPGAIFSALDSSAKVKRLIKIMVSSPACSYHSAMAYILFRCPYTGLNVQYPLSDDASLCDDESAYEAVTCPACSRLHLVNKLTGKLLGDHKKT